MADEENQQNPPATEDQAGNPPADGETPAEAVEGDSPEGGEGDAAGAAAASEEDEVSAPKEPETGLSLVGFAGLGLTAWGVLSIINHHSGLFLLGVGLMMYGIDDLIASLRSPNRNVAGPWAMPLNLFRTIFVTAMGFYTLLAATPWIPEPDMVVYVLVWGAYYMVYSTLVILSGILSKDRVELAPLFLMASIMMMFASYVFFSLFLHLTLAATFASLALISGGVSLWKKVLRDLPRQGLTGIVFMLALFVPFFVFIVQHLNEELQPVLGLHQLVTQKHLDDLGKQVKDLKWAPPEQGVSQKIVGGDAALLNLLPQRSRRLEFAFEPSDPQEWKNVGTRYTFIYDEDRNNPEREDFGEENAGQVKVYTQNPDSQGFWWSPDATRMAYTELDPDAGGYTLRVIDERLDKVTKVEAPDADEDEAEGEVKKVEAKGDHHMVMEPPLMVYDKRVWPMVESHGQIWSQDSHELLFASPVSNHKDTLARIKKGRTAIYKANLKTGSVEKLTSGSSKVYPAWAPDGSRITYVTYKTVDPYLEMAEGNGSRPRRFRWTREQSYFPAWNQKQTKVLYIKDSRLWIMNSNGTNKRPYTSSSIKDRVWFTSEKVKFLLYWVDPLDSWLIKDMASNGRGKHRVLYECKENECDEIYPPIYSPDARRIAFVVRHGDSHKIYTMGRDGDREGDWATMFFASKDKIDSILFSPSSNKMAYMVRRRDKPVEEIWTVNYDRDDRDALDPQKVFERVARVRSLSWSANEQYLAFEEMHRWGLGGFAIVRPPIYRVKVVDLPTKKVRPIYPYSQFSRQPAFSPNGSLLAFVANEHRAFPTDAQLAAIWIAQIQ